MDPTVQQKIDMLNHTVDAKWEKDKLDAMLRDLLRDGFNSGDYCVYTYWDKNKHTKQYNGLVPGTEEQAEIMGDFCNEIKDGSEIMFGNPNDRRVQTQPYILVVGRGLVKDLREEAKNNKVPKDEYMQIIGDKETDKVAGERGKIELDNNDDDNASKCLYIIKMWKKDGQVYYRKTTKYCTIIKEQPMGLKRYPIAWGNWKKRKNSYHGMAPGTALVPNQVAVNQMYSMIVYHMKQTAFGKVVYDSTRIQNYDNRVGGAIGANGDISNIIYQVQPGQMNTQLPSILEDMVSKTKELNGASDASLGDINPEQASGTSIAYTQKANAIPLDNPRANLYEFVEDLLLNWQDFIESKYTVPRKIGYKEKNVSRVGEINGQDYKDMPLSLKIDVGPSMMWSEVTSVNTLNNLLAGGKITFLQYLERLPDGFIEDKQGLIEEIKAQIEQQQELIAGQDEMSQNIQMQSQQLAEQQKQAQYEKMMEFFEQLPDNVQTELKKLPDDKFEQAVIDLMNNPQLVQQ